MKAVFVDCTPELKTVIESRALDVPGFLHIHYGDPSEEDLALLLTDADVLLVEHTVIPVAVLDSSPRLKGIVFMGTGAESYVPVHRAEELGIKVRNTPGYGSVAVAEHAMALTFAAARRVSVMDRDVRKGMWRPLGGLQLEGSKVAVIGLGEIGRAYASRAVALGMKVSGWNRTPLDVPYYVASIEEALDAADVVSLHLSLNDQTKHIIDARRLNLLNHGAIIINTARAALIDERALHAALASGHISHAGLDVFWEEPLPIGSEWPNTTTVTLTAHAAYMTDDAYAELWARTLSAIRGIT